MKETYYFQHDYNARNDDKVKKLIRKHGFLGYGLFWAIIEDLYNNDNSLSLDYEGIAFDLRTECDCIKSIINDFDLFVIDGDTFGSLSVQKRLEARDAKSRKARESARKRWDKEPTNNERNAYVMRTHSDGNARKEKKKKKEKDIPSLNEFMFYAFQQKKTLNKEAVEAKYKSWVENGWRDGFDREIKNWKSKLLNTIPHLKEDNPQEKEWTPPKLKYL